LSYGRTRLVTMIHLLTVILRAGNPKGECKLTVGSFTDPR